MSAQQGCPVDVRKSVPDTERAAAPTVEVDGDVWHIRSLPAVRHVLRAARETRQAGFGTEFVERSPDRDRRPVLFLDGPEHRTARQRVARYFAPRTVERRYRDFITVRADELIDAMARQDEVELSEVTMRYAVEVAAQVLGLQDADMAGMARRLSRFFALDPGAPGAGRNRLVTTINLARITGLMWAFNRYDVLPAIRARRATPADDVISHLIAEGHTDREILVECITYAAAGMVTTREFIVMVTWHLLENPDLRAEFLAADRDRRLDVLGEILRLEPVVGHLYRRATESFTVEDGDTVHTVPAGALIDLDVRRANVDPDAIGHDPRTLCPGRPLPAKTPPEAASFGDGYHRCPGNHIAMEETDALLTRLLARPLTVVSTPTMTWGTLVSGYELRGLRVKVGTA